MYKAVYKSFPTSLHFCIIDKVLLYFCAKRQHKKIVYRAHPQQKHYKARGNISAKKNRKVYIPRRLII
jgi:hypothetical protein